MKKLFVILAFTLLNQGLALSCEDKIENVNTSIDIQTVDAHNANGSANCEVRKLALYYLINSNDPTTLEASLTAIKSQGQYSRNSATIIADFLKKDNDEALRTLAAKVWYLLFYDLSDPELQKESYAYLTDESTILIFQEMITLDKHAGVKRFIAETGQLLLNPYIDTENVLRTNLTEAEKERAEKLAEIYVPILLKALLKDMTDEGSSLRTEILNSINKLTGAKAVTAPENLSLILKWDREEKSPDNMGFFDWNPVLAPKILAGRK